jgi:hypothetical protein
MNENEAINIVGMFMSAYPATNADDNTVDLWVNALGTVDPNDGALAAREWISTSKFFPTIAEIREILSGYRRRRALEDGPRQVGERTVSFADGIRAMRAGYELECRIQGRTPTPSNVAAFDRGQFPRVGTA